MDIKTFMGRLDSYIKEYPLEAEKAMRKEANRMKKELVSASPVGKGRKRKISKSWKMAINGNSSSTLEATLRNTSPHFHLVERGHVKKAEEEDKEWLTDYHKWQYGKLWQRNYMTNINARFIVTRF